MAYFNCRDVAAISVCAALWGVLNSFFAPLFFRATGLPFLCDSIGFTVLIIAVWWTRKFGAVTAIGLVATGISFVLNPGGIHFLGFAAASFVFDLLTRFIGYSNYFGKPILTILTLLPVSVVSAAFAGYTIGSLFMPSQALANWGGALGWAGLHATGGVIGGAIGVSLVLAFNSRQILKSSVKRGDN